MLVELAKACCPEKNILFLINLNLVQLWKILANRMRNLCLHVQKEYGQENFIRLQKGEKIEKKMAEFQNHRRFSLRCLSSEVIRVRVRLKSNIKTPRVWHIIRRSKRQLLNECIRSISNTLELHKYQSEAYISQLKEELDQMTMEEYQELVKRVIEARHSKVLECQRVKYETLCHQKTGGHSNSNYGYEKPVEQGVGTALTTSWVKIPWQKLQNIYWPMGPILPLPQSVHPMETTLLWWNMHASN